MKPENVNGHAVFNHFETRGLPGGRMAAVAAHNEIGANVDFPGIVPGYDSGDASVVPEQIACLVLHEQSECGEFAGVTGEEVEKIPLRHQGDELADCRDMAEIGHFERRPAHADAGGGDLLMRQAEELLKQTEFVEDLERGRVDRVAAEVTEEIGVLLEHGDLDAAACQQVTQHHACGAAACDTAGCVQDFGFHRMPPPVESYSGDRDLVSWFAFIRGENRPGRAQAGRNSAERGKGWIQLS